MLARHIFRMGLKAVGRGESGGRLVVEDDTVTNKLAYPVRQALRARVLHELIEEEKREVERGRGKR